MDEKIKPKTRRNINTINKIVGLLQERNMNTREIHSTLQEVWPRWCPGMKRLSNILSKNSEFVETGKEFVEATLSGSYKVVIWGLSSEGRLNN